MAQRTCTLNGCERPHYCKGMCKPCYRRDYYQRNRERELAGMARWREENYEYDRQRFAAYAQRRWGAERAARAEAKAAKIAAPDKVCTRCQMTKAKTEFHLSPRSVDGRHSWCKACFYAHCKSVEDRDVANARRRRTWKANPESRERELARHRAWSKANPEKNRQYARRYQALKLAATVGEVDYGALIEQFGMVCHLCRQDIADLADLHFDHVIPLVRGGAHSMANIRPAHATCNLRKKDKLLSELDWLPVS